MPVGPYLRGVREEGLHFGHELLKRVRVDIVACIDGDEARVRDEAGHPLQQFLGHMAAFAAASAHEIIAQILEREMERLLADGLL